MFVFPPFICIHTLTERTCNPACKNGGTCIDEVCTCDDGYYGDACTGKDSVCVCVVTVFTNTYVCIPVTRPPVEIHVCVNACTTSELKKSYDWLKRSEASSYVRHCRSLLMAVFHTCIHMYVHACVRAFIQVLLDWVDSKPVTAVI